MIKNYEVVWGTHVLFRGAPQIVAHAAEINRVLEEFGPLASAWIPESCESALFDIFAARPPRWPAYDVWVEEQHERGIAQSAFGPLGVPPIPNDFLEWAPITSLRAAGKELGLQRVGRSKAEVIASIAPLAPLETLTALRAEGQARWHRFEELPARMTIFRVLHNTLAGIICTYRNLDMAVRAQIATYEWIAPVDDCPKCQSFQDRSFSVVRALQNTLEDAPPAHPGCRCVVVFAKALGLSLT